MRTLLFVLFFMASFTLAQEPVTTGGHTGTVSETGEQATTEEAPAGCMGFGGGGITGLLPIVGMIAIFYFLIIRPQQKQQKKLREMRGSLQIGDRVVTSGGIHGVIKNHRNDIMTVKIADGVKIDVDRSSLTLLAPDDQGQESQ